MTVMYKCCDICGKKEERNINMKAINVYKLKDDGTVFTVPLLDVCEDCKKQIMTARAESDMKVIETIKRDNGIIK